MSVLLLPSVFDSVSQVGVCACRLLDVDVQLCIYPSGEDFNRNLGIATLDFATVHIYAEVPSIVSVRLFTCLSICVHPSNAFCRSDHLFMQSIKLACVECSCAAAVPVHEAIRAVSLHLCLIN
jgi:hypothetical protein